jgi:hypothetical protein
MYSFRFLLHSFSDVSCTVTGLLSFISASFIHSLSSLRSSPSFFELTFASSILFSLCSHIALSLSQRSATSLDLPFTSYSSSFTLGESSSPDLTIQATSRSWRENSFSRSDSNLGMERSLMKRGGTEKSWKSDRHRIK